MIALIKLESTGTLPPLGARMLKEERAIVTVNHLASTVVRSIREGRDLSDPQVRHILTEMARVAVDAAAFPHLLTTNAADALFRSVMLGTQLLAQSALELGTIRPDTIDHKNIMPEPIAPTHTDEQITMRSAWKGSNPEHPPVVGTIDGEEWFGVPRSTYYRMKDGLAHSEGVSALHDCNDCPDRNDCLYVPQPGEWVRINCPLHPNVEGMRSPRMAKGTAERRKPYRPCPDRWENPEAAALEGAWSKC